MKGPSAAWVMCDIFKKQTLQNKSEDANSCAHPHQANSEVTQFIIQKKKKKRDGP